MSTKTWQNAVADGKFIRAFALAFFTMVVCLVCTKYFLVYNDTRTGTLLNDPILALFKPIDVTWINFFLIFTSTIFGITIILRYPADTVQWMFAYSLVLVFRILSLYFVPLQPPTTMIYLHDPIVAAFIGKTTPVHDLFFSGHTATAFLVFLGVKKYKPFFLFASIAIGILVIMQHVHYTIDVLAAPFFAYFAFKLSKKLTEFLGIQS